jgi:single-strand DNA-binding protein
MASLNECALIGNCGRDPEMRFTQEGKAVTGFSLGVNTTRKGEKTTDWFEIQCWEKLAEVANEYLSKGKQVFIRGSVSLNTWEGKDGAMRSQMRVTANKLVLLGSKDDAKPKAAEEEDF